MALLEELIAAMEAEARRAPFPIDEEPYLRAGRDPLVPIPCAGNPAARICSFGRDLGRDEVLHGQPQVGAAGRLVRRGILEAVGRPAPPGDRLLESALEYVFLANTVPYKPPGNRAYSESVRERFRPHIAALLGFYWQGDTVLTLGTEAFMRFARYAPPGAAAAFWRREDRYESEFACVLEAGWDGRSVRRDLRIGPLPHPSPLNQKWVGRFPNLLRARLRPLAPA